MTLDHLPVEQTLEKVRQHMAEETGLSPARRASLELLLTLFTLLLNRLGLNSRNSRQSPSMDPNRDKKGHTGKSNHTQAGRAEWT